MQCLIQSEHQNLSGFLGTLTLIRDKDTTFFIETKNILTGEVEFEPFPNIQNQTIERFHKNFTESRGDQAHRFANIGEHTIDIQLMAMFLTDQPGNILAMQKVKRGETHLRMRPRGHSRFTGNLTRDESVRSSVGSDDGDKNGLGK